MTIQAIDENTFQVVKGAHTMTLTRKGTEGWEMLTSNPSTVAWNRFPSVKRFGTLSAVEANYKSWKGITHLVTDHVSA